MIRETKKGRDVELWAYVFSYLQLCSSYDDVMSCCATDQEQSQSQLTCPWN
jgi:hypothetical protein